VRTRPLQVGMGKDHTLFSLVTGHVLFAYDAARKRSSVSVVDRAAQAAAADQHARRFTLEPVPPRASAA
jgi:hypothetical protein